MPRRQKSSKGNYVSLGFNTDGSLFIPNYRYCIICGDGKDRPIEYYDLTVDNGRIVTGCKSCYDWKEDLETRLPTNTSDQATNEKNIEERRRELILRINASEQQQQ